MNQIDHKDEPGEYRTAVFEEVQKALRFRGEPPTDPAFFIGDWISRFCSGDAQSDSLARSYQSFFADGAAPAKAVDGTWESPKDRWNFNDDRSFSLWSYVDAMPEYGIEEATYSEECYHVLIKGREEFVLFNGDGSSIMVYARTNGGAHEA